MEAIIVAAISAFATIAVALINAWATRHRSAPQPAEPESVAAKREERAGPGRVEFAWRRLWELFGGLPPLRRRRAAWVAAIVGFIFGGVGVALYFRKQADVLVGLALLIPLLLASQGEGASTDVSSWYWPFAALAGTYCVLRVESSNRRLEAAAADEARALVD